jgi:hypothetical protein
MWLPPTDGLAEAVETTSVLEAADNEQPCCNGNEAKSAKKARDMGPASFTEWCGRDYGILL